MILGIPGRSTVNEFHPKSRAKVVAKIGPKKTFRRPLDTFKTIGILSRSANRGVWAFAWIWRTIDGT